MAVGPGVGRAMDKASRAGGTATKLQGFASVLAALATLGQPHPVIVNQSRRAAGEAWKREDAEIIKYLRAGQRTSTCLLVLGPD